MSKNQQLPAWILFDCMETLVDFNPIPQQRDYARWAFEGSGVEGLWKGFDEFFQLFQKAVVLLNNEKEKLEEWASIERYNRLCQLTPGINVINSYGISKRLQENFFANYCANCFVRKDTIDAIPQLANRFYLAVVSNFKVKSGIEHILEQFNLLQHFQWVLTSIDMGWRKPHPAVYEEAISRTESSPEKILFVGDDVQNDVEAPLALGMDAIHLDRYNQYEPGENLKRLDSFNRLLELLIKAG